ncbi:MAG: heterodisulfide reductase-related iron-sulfur binding cluster [Candidatus Lernaella stagnicola]|nr:heterodisulfide reductase-related iron-sulfur binding cluster [Candidatus Lernaella stagnicola]
MAVTKHVAESGVERLAMWEMYPGFWSYTRWIIYGLAVVVVAIFAYGLWTRFKAYRMGRKAEGRLDNVGARVGSLLKYWIGQLKVLQETYQGVLHLMIFWGFVVLFIGTSLTVLDEDLYRLLSGGQKFIHGDFYVVFSFLLDLFGLLAIIGVLMAMYRRYVMKPEGLDNRAEDALFLWFLLGVLVTGFLSEGARIGVVMAEKGQVAYEASSFVGYGLGKIFGGSAGLHQAFWTIHVLASMVFIASIPYYKARHIFTTGINIYTATLKPTGKMIEPIPSMMERMEAGEDVELGYKRIEELTWREIAQLDGCLRCGRCQDVCPAYETKKGREVHLSPKDFIQAVKDYWWAKVEAEADAAVEKTAEEGEAQATEGLEGSVADGHFLLKSEAAMWGEEYRGAIDSTVLWDCTNCMACMHACPAMIEHVPLITYMRRELAMEFDDSEKACKTFFKNMDTNANPWGFSPSERMSWIAEEGVPTVFENPDFEYLWYVGDLGSYDPKAIKANRALAKIFKEAGLNVAVLGEMEFSEGDSLRRLGNEASFQALVMMFKQTVEECELDPTFKGKKVVTADPHSYNCLKHEYPDFGFQWEVFHHTEILAQLIREQKIKLRGGNGKTATYHDSCFLARYNDIVQEPRDVLAACGYTVIEPARTGKKTFCCGGGGGRAWLEEDFDPEQGIDRCNNVRSEELAATGATDIVSACPLCGMMFDEALKRPQMEEVMEGKRQMDIAEIVFENTVFSEPVEAPAEPEEQA